MVSDLFEKQETYACQALTNVAVSAINQMSTTEQEEALKDCCNWEGDVGNILRGALRVQARIDLLPELRCRYQMI